MVLCALGQSTGFDEGRAHSWVDVMGLSLRVVGWRLTLWYPWDKTRGVAHFGAEPSRVPVELYAHPADGSAAADMDASENVNLAGVPAHAAVQRALERRLLDHFAPLAREARRYTPRRRGAGAAGDNSVEEREEQEQQEQQEQEQGEAQGEAQGEGWHEARHGARPGTRWRQYSMPRPYSYSMLRASLRNESGKRLQHRRERGALLAARRLGRRQRRTAQRGTALVPEMLVPVESVAVQQASPG